MNKLIKICALSFAYSILAVPSSVNAQPDTIIIQEEEEIEEVTIESASQHSLVGLSPVVIIGSSEISSLPGGSLQELLRTIANIDIRQRGSGGIQADLSLMGGTFDQCIVLLNGINITDPQTGHFTLNLPVTPEDIERIEIYSGADAGLYAGKSYTGMLNVVTIKPSSHQLTVKMKAGNYGFHSQHVSGSYGNKNHSQYLSLNRSNSDGYSENTDFTSYHLFYGGEWKSKEASLTYHAGFNQKAFGANKFYTGSRPEFEENKAIFSDITLKTGKKIQVEPSLFWKRHYDHFILFRDNPSLYQNDHLTDVLGTAILAGTRLTSRIEMQSGIENRSENILSTNIGNSLYVVQPVAGTERFYKKAYHRTSTTFYQGFLFRIKKITMLNNYNLAYHSDIPNKTRLYPALDIIYNTKGKISPYVQAARSYRMPTFTDLFYTDPYKRGNNNLKPEESWKIAAGTRASSRNINVALSLWYRQSDNAIDWAFDASDSLWHTRNISSINTRGLTLDGLINTEAIIGETCPLKRFRFNYSYINSTLDENQFISLYVLDYLKHKAGITVEISVFKKLDFQWTTAYYHRNAPLTYNTTTASFIQSPYKPYWLTDIRLQWKEKSFTTFIESSNLFDTGYFDINQVTQPGRWIMAGLKMNVIDFIRIK